MSNHLSDRLRRLVLVGAMVCGIVSLCPPFTALPNQAKGQAQQAPPQEEKKDAEVPKAPKDDFMVQVYQALDEKKATKLTAKEKYKQDKTEEDVEVVLSYFNWSISDDDYWNRQVTLDTKTTDGFVIEKMVKSGFGELGYVKQGDSKTQDVYRKEKITVSGGQATATMADAQIGPAEKERFRKLLDRMVLKK
ncbi:MAG: hypothetical protein L0387_06925 [Acidobacteria bacterium]|nr:hypothetical protein [Acidobacteriota bacterium]MCI0621388.1 hypothetical protein [Acidobacteriota bacterium]MCI0722724.1 hypothetical protein [Acidobacteriota bacterium]